MQVVIVGSGRADLVAQPGTYVWVEGPRLSFCFFLQLGFGVFLGVSLGLRWQLSLSLSLSVSQARSQDQGFRGVFWPGSSQPCTAGFVPARSRGLMTSMLVL